jgi:hypothetical protein
VSIALRVWAGWRKEFWGGIDGRGEGRGALRVAGPSMLCI